ncbi:hypothetical protein Acife_1202 [Acidithiobacillus ferrivorans SS3]|uniref:Uncharacterized protein n=1 Tax=Acidithiobacillus ferrivorans SS3 TaxID=743299 RepID=G0JPC8_9PROT|nr:hypothetical protein [Acidithiobacillus ferrivorans]AEM47359.1 hypothetical protein Acife_1202 [Acidithiobacillus ferrivorans SS3]MBU2768689.1 hypothetical protein [Acidithiobacillus ferrivorans]OFA17152.1 hypothetical protein A4U49_03600 [Acidithiobacillus ferrivorans]
MNANTSATLHKISTQSTCKELTHEELLADMRAFRDEVAQSPEKARAFLKSIGVMRDNGEIRHLIHD